MILKPSDRVAGMELSLVRQMYQNPPLDYIDLGLGQLDEKPPYRFRMLAAKIVKDSKAKYSPNAGITELRETIANDYNKRHGTDYKTGNVIVTVGSTEGMFSTLLSFLDGDDALLIPSIAYSAYEVIGRISQTNNYLYDLDSRFELNVKSMEERLCEAREKGRNNCIVVINTPNNPTGKVLSEENVRQSVEVASKYDAWILSDEIYDTLVFDGGRTVSPSEFYDQTIVLSGGSKRFAIQGYRVGWVIAPQEVVEKVLPTHQYMVTCAPVLFQRAVLECLNIESEEGFVRELEMKRNFVYEELLKINGIEIIKPEGAFYAFPNISKFGNSMEVANRIKEEVSVIVIPGRAFGRKGDDYIRISFASDWKDLKEGMGRIGRYFRCSNG